MRLRAASDDAAAVRLDGLSSGLPPVDLRLEDAPELVRRYDPPGAIWSALAGLVRLEGCHPLLGAGADDVLLRLGVALRACGFATWHLSYPSYEPHARILRGLGLRVQTQPAGPLAEHLAATVEGRVGEGGVHLLVNPGNPTGVLLPAALVESLARANPRAHVVVDEAFIGCRPEESVAGRLAGLPNVTVVQTLSKAYGLPGVRFGWAVTGDGALARSWQRLFPPFYPSVLHQRALAWVGENATAVAEANLARQAAAEGWMARLRERGIDHSASVSNLVYFHLDRPAAERFLSRARLAGVQVTHGLESEAARGYFRRDLRAGRIPVRVYATPLGGTEVADRLLDG